MLARNRASIAARQLSAVRRRLLRRASSTPFIGRAASPSVISLSEEVKEALATQKPVVALESTIVTHGLPFPANLEMSRDVESIVRAEGAVPATISFLDGVPKVGLSAQELEDLAHSKDAVKVSRRDIAHVLSHKLTGGTTIAATMILANMAGIPVFATGGLGGVHRGVASTWDISADLEELGRLPVAVVCSGPKSILDVPKTLEYLETKGCYVSTYNPDGFPANVPGFFVADSGVPSPYTFNGPAQAARTIDAGARFGLESGFVFCVPAAAEHALDPSVVSAAIDFALAEADKRGIMGKATTPFLLQKVWEATGGDSVRTNVEFVKRNAKMAAQIARGLAALRSGSSLPGAEATAEATAAAATAAAPAESLRTESLRTEAFHPSSAHPAPSGPGSGGLAESQLKHEKYQNDMREEQITQAMLTQRQLNNAQHELGSSGGGDGAAPHGDFGPSAAAGSKPAETTRGIHLPVRLKPRAVANRVLGDSLYERSAVAVIGALSQDITCTLNAENISVSSYPGRITTSLGGTAHNVALASAYSGASTKLVSCVGYREETEIAKSVSPVIDVSGVRVSDKERTSRYVCTNDAKGELIVACADMDAINNLDAHFIKDQLMLSRPDVCVFDGNIGLEQQSAVLGTKSKDYDPLIVFEPTSVPKAARLAEQKELGVFPNATLDIATPNYLEVMSMFEEFSYRERFSVERWFPVIDQLPLSDSFTRMKLDIFARSHPSLENVIVSGLVQASLQLLPFIPNLFVTNGKNGVISFQLIENLKDRTGGVKDGPSSVYILSKNRSYGVLIHHFPITVEVSDEDAKSVNGIGDTFCGALVAQLARDRSWLRDDGPRKMEHVARAMHAASLSLQTYQAVNSDMASLFEPEAAA